MEDEELDQQLQSAKLGNGSAARAALGEINARLSRTQPLTDATLRALVAGLAAIQSGPKGSLFLSKEPQATTLPGRPKGSQKKTSLGEALQLYGEAKGYTAPTRSAKKLQRTRALIHSPGTPGRPKKLDK